MSFELKRISCAEARDETYRYNSLPHSLYTGEEYEAHIYDCELAVWFPQCKHLMKEPYFHQHVFTTDEMQTLESASRILCLSARDPVQYEEDLVDIERRITANWPSIGDAGVFVRFGAASPKDSFVPRRGFMDASTIVGSLINSLRVHKNCFGRRLDHNRVLYFSRFDADWDIFNEWRVFVFDAKVVAISQYDWTLPLPTTDVSFVHSLVTRIHEMAASVVEATSLKTFVMDVYREKDGEVKLVELNNYVCAGSCLFRWKEDAEIIPRIGAAAPTNNVVQVRIAVDSMAQEFRADVLEKQLDAEKVVVRKFADSLATTMEILADVTAKNKQLAQKLKQYE